MSAWWVLSIVIPVFFAILGAVIRIRYRRRMCRMMGCGNPANGRNVVITTVGPPTCYTPPQAPIAVVSPHQPATIVPSELPAYNGPAAVPVAPPVYPTTATAGSGLAEPPPPYMEKI